MKKIITLGVALLLVACAHVETTTATYHGANHSDRGIVRVDPINKEQASSLEFKAVSDYLGKKLEAAGYLNVPSSSETEFVAYITYGIDDGKTTSSTVPIFGQTGGGATYSSGTVMTNKGFGSYSGTSYTMPTYGVVGIAQSSSVEYKRVVNIDIFRMQKNNPPAKVYEVKAVSSGRCPTIGSVIKPIIDAIFLNFPGENGKTKTINVNTDGRSC